MNAEHDHTGEIASSTSSASERPLLIAFVLTMTMLVGETVGGLWSGSLALLADAGHMLVDAGALLFSYIGARVATRPADARRSFGYARIEVLVGYSNALVQFLLVAWIVIEAALRLGHPTPIKGGAMLGFAAAGLAVNIIVLGVLGERGHDHDHGDVNKASARLHVLGDLLASVGAIGAAVLVWTLGWLWADAAVSILVSLLILGSAWRLLRRCAHILLEGTPDDADATAVAAAVHDADIGVSDVHHVHVWQLGSNHRVATLHALLEAGVDADQAIASIRDLLRRRFHVTHATVQFDRRACAQSACGSVGSGSARSRRASAHDGAHLA